MHSDFVSGSDTIASFLYLSSGWSPENGGYFHFFETNEQRAPALSVDRYRIDSSLFVSGLLTRIR